MARKPPTQTRASLRYQGDYDPAEFIVPAADGKGHSTRAIFRLGIDYDEEVNRVVQSRLFPFADKSAFLRYAVREALLTLEGLETVPNSVFQMAEAAMLIARQTLHHRQYDETFETLRESFELLRSRPTPALGEIRRLYAQMQHCFEQMPDGYWRTQYRARLHDEFGYLVDPAGTAAPEGSRAYESRKAGGGESV